VNITAEQARRELARRELARRGEGDFLDRLSANAKEQFSAKEIFKAPVDFVRTAAEDVGAFASLAAKSSPVDIATGFGAAALAGVDRNFGTDLIDNDEEIAKAFLDEGEIYVDEMKDHENRPFRALSNASIGLGGIGLLAKLGTIGKLGKAGKVANAANKISKVATAAEAVDPLTAIYRGAKASSKALAGAVKGGTSSRVANATEGITTEGSDGLLSEMWKGAIGLYNSQGARGMEEYTRRIKDPISRAIIDQQLKQGINASANAEENVLRAVMKVQDRAAIEYRKGVDAMKESGVWDTQVGGDATEVAKSLFEEGFRKAGVPISVEPIYRKLDPDLPFRGNEGFGNRPVGYKLSGDGLRVRDASLNKMTDVFQNILDEAGQRGHFTVADLDAIKQGLDDELSVINAANPMNRSAKTALQNIRHVTRDLLDRAGGYNDAMLEYSKRMDGLRDVEKNFGIDLDLSEQRKALREGGRASQPNLGDRLQKVFDTGDGDVPAREKALSGLEDLSGNKNLGDDIIGAKFQQLAPNGLIGKQETSGAFRKMATLVGTGGAIGLVTGGTTGAVMAGAAAGLALTVPAFVLLSPRAGAKFLSHMAARGEKVGKYRKAAMRINAESDKWHAAMKAKGFNTKSFVSELEKSGLTLGELLNQYQRMGRTQKRVEKKNIFRTLGAR